jgi:pimeloyl-ACP methyl ester carboxylesterase
MGPSLDHGYVLCKETIMRWLRTVWLTVVVLSSGLAWQAWADDAPPPRHLRVNGVELSYIDQRTGAPVVFIHGAFSDLRIWEAQRPAVAQQYRFIAYTQRYHGTDRWPDEGQHYAAATHAADLAAFLRVLQVGPVHLVAHSAGGVVATLVAVDHPDLVRSLTLAEPGIGTLLADLPEGKPPLDERAQALAQVRTAVNAGDAVQATKVFFEWVNNQGPGTFDQQPEAVRQMFLDNARTLPLLLAAPPPPALSCATLGGVKAPTLVIDGERTRRFFSLISEVTVQCMPSSRLVTIPQATHPTMFFQNPAAFNEALLQFRAQH